MIRTRAEVKDFLEEARLLLSSLFARKATKLIVGVLETPTTWYFSNLSYKTKTGGNEYYWYQASVDHFIHAVTFRSFDVHKNVRELIDRATLKYGMMILDTAALMGVFRDALKDDRWNEADFALIRKGKNIHLYFRTDVEDSNALFQLQGKVAYGDQVGITVDHHYTDRVVHRSNCARTLTQHPNTFTAKPNIEELRKKEITIQEVKVDDNIYKLPLLDGINCASIREYVKKSKLPYTLDVCMLLMTKVAMDVVMHYVDETIDVVSFRPGVIYLPVPKITQPTDKKE